jgi:hypothetical protein
MMATLGPEETVELRKRQRGRNIALAIVLAALVVLFFFITLVRIGGAM